jgi:hypothetical protein
MLVSARLGTGMGMQEQVVYAPAVTVEVVQGYFLDAPSGAALAPGGKAELKGAIRREKGFTSPVSIAVEGLPPNVTCPVVDTGEDAVEYAVHCEAGPAAEPGAYAVQLNASSILAGGEEGKVPYKIAPVEMKLVVRK